MIDITMTATLRTPIHTKVFESLCKNIQTTEDLRLIINIDCIGLEENPLDVVKNAKKYFSNIKYNISEKASHHNACIWAFDTAESAFIVNWEDDFVLLKPLNLDICKEILENDEDAALIGFDWTFKKAEVEKAQSIIQNYKDFYYYQLKPRLHLPPALHKKEYIKGVSERLKTTTQYTDPGKFFRQKEIGREYVNKWKFYRFLGETKEGKLIEDIGRPWKTLTKIKIKR